MSATPRPFEVNPSSGSTPSTRTADMLFSLLMGLMIGGLLVYLIVGRFDGYEPPPAAVVAQVESTATSEPSATPEPTRTPWVSVGAQPSRTPWPTSTPVEFCTYWDEHPELATPGAKCRVPKGPVTPTPTMTPVDCDSVEPGSTCNWEPRDETTTPTVAVPVPSVGSATAETTGL